MKFLKLLSIFKDHQIIITYPNFDPGYQYIINKIINIKKKLKDTKVIKHLGKKTSLLTLLYWKKKKVFAWETLRVVSKKPSFIIVHH